MSNRKYSSDEVMKMKLPPHHSPFAGNGLSRTAMLYKIATLAGRKLTPVELNQIKNINPRRLESVYNEVILTNDKGQAAFALQFILK